MSQVPAATQTVAVLRYLGAQAGPVPAAVIARDLTLPRSTVYHLLTVLADEGFVVHLPDERRYGLGLGAYELGTGYTRQAPLQRLARVPLAAMVDRRGHSGHLAVMHGREVVYVIEERARGRAALVTDVGVRLPAHLTATGRAILAALPVPQVRALYPDPGTFIRRHDVGPASPSALRALLAAVRRRGHAMEDGEVTPGFASVAAAVVDHVGHPVAAIALTFARADVDGPREAVLAGDVRQTAALISRRLGA